MRSLSKLKFIEFSSSHHASLSDTLVLEHFLEVLVSFLKASIASKCSFGIERSRTEVVDLFVDAIASVRVF